MEKNAPGGLRRIRTHQNPTQTQHWILKSISVRNVFFDFFNRLREIVGELGRRMAAQVTELGTLKANYKDIKWQVM